jgi:hypothetical protein
MRSWWRRRSWMGRRVRDFFWVTRCLDADVNEVSIQCTRYDLMRQVKMAHNAVCLVADKWFRTQVREALRHVPVSRQMLLNTR